MRAPVRVVWLLFLVVVLAACDTAGSPPNGGGGGEVVVDDRARVLDSATSQALVDYAGDGTLRFSGSTALLDELEAGDVLVAGVVPGAAPQGFLRTVASVDRSGGEVTVQTGPAQLTDVIRRGSVRVRRPLDGLVTSATPLVEGLTIRTRPAGVPATQDGDGEHDVELGFDEVLLGGENASVSVDGSITLDSQIVFNLDIDSSLSRGVWVDLFELYLALDQTAQLNLTAEAELGFEKELPIATFTLASIEFNIGPVPVVLSIDLTLFLGADGTISARFTTGAVQTASLDAGGRYSDDGGWEGIWDPNATFDFIPPTFEASAEARAFVGARVAAGLYGEQGAAGTITTRAYLRGDAVLGRNPLWCIYGGLEATYGYQVNLPLIGNLVEHEEPLAGLEEEIACGAGQAPEIEIVSPQDGEVFDEASTWTYDATLEGTSAEVADVSWTIDGERAEPGLFDVRTLCPGEHTIVAVARTPDGATSSDAVTVTVANRAPTVAIDDAPPSVGEDNAARFTGSVVDPTCTDPTGTAVDLDLLAWDVEDGFGGTGASLITTFTSQGTKTVELAYVDVGGLEGTDAVNVEVGPFDPGAGPVVAIDAPQDGRFFRVSELVNSEYRIDVVAETGAGVDDADLVWSARAGSGGSFAEFARGLTATYVQGPPPGRQTVEIRLHVDGEPISGASTDAIEIVLEQVAQ